MAFEDFMKSVLGSMLVDNEFTCHIQLYTKFEVPNVTCCKNIVEINFQWLVCCSICVPNLKYIASAILEREACHVSQIMRS